MPLPTELPPDAVAALSQGNKIEAIKIVREAWHLGLKESKDAVEDHLRNNPALATDFQEASARAGSGGKQLLLVILLIAAGVAAYFYLAKP